MWEPRGHADMYGGWIGSPISPDADLSVLFTHNDGFSTMCGHGIIALVKVVLDTRILPSKEQIGIDTPAGLVIASAEREKGTVTRVLFRNVASFVHRRDVTVPTASFGPVRCDIAYGGAFYAFVEGSSLSLVPTDVTELVRAGREIKAAVSEIHPPRHPERADLSFLYGVIFTWPPRHRSHHSRQVCVFADGEVDRSPTGTGVSARLAILHDAGEVAIGDEILVESIVGSVFSGRVAELGDVSGLAAVVPEIGGSAHITGRAELWFDPADPLAGGFLLG